MAKSIKHPCGTCGNHDHGTTQANGYRLCDACVEKSHNDELDVWKIIWSLPNRFSDIPESELAPYTKPVEAPHYRKNSTILGDVHQWFLNPDPAPGEGCIERQGDSLRVNVNTVTYFDIQTARKLGKAILAACDFEELKKEEE